MKNYLAEIAVYLLRDGRYIIYYGDHVFIDSPNGALASIHVHRMDLPIISLEDFYSVLMNHERYFGILTPIDEFALFVQYSFRRISHFRDTIEIIDCIRHIAKTSFETASLRIEEDEYIIGLHNDFNTLMRFNVRWNKTLIPLF